MKKLNLLSGARKNLFLGFLILFAIFFFSACADVSLVEECVTGKVYGFWNGLWHGMVSGISFIGSLFNDEIAVYGVNNNGGWYDFGFLLGVGAFTGGTTHSSTK